MDLYVFYPDRSMLMHTNTKQLSLAGTEQTCMFIYCIHVHERFHAFLCQAIHLSQTILIFSWDLHENLHNKSIFLCWHISVQWHVLKAESRRTQRFNILDTNHPGWSIHLIIKIDIINLRSRLSYIVESSVFGYEGEACSIMAE